MNEDHLNGKYTWFEKQDTSTKTRESSPNHKIQDSETFFGIEVIMAEVVGKVEVPSRPQTPDENESTPPVAVTSCQLHVVTIKSADADILYRELSYIGQDCFRLPSVLAKSYGHQTRRLDLSYNNIKTLDGLDKFTVLEDLVLDNNNLTDDVTFHYNENLHTLSLNKNNFDNLDGLLNKLSKCYPNLSYLSILGNPACPDQLSSSEKDDDDYQRYRYHVLYILPKLNFLDFKLVKNSERREALRIGAFVKVIRPPQRVIDESIDEDVIDVARFNPLPETTTLEGSHKGAFGVLRYKYSGKHSEGNRFIRNNEL